MIRFLMSVRELLARVFGVVIPRSENQRLADETIQRLMETRRVIASVESCTGGLVSHLLTNVSGSSQVVWGAFVTYDNSAKECLGVSSVTLKRHGPFSAETAVEMAESALRRVLQCRSFSPDMIAPPREIICVSTTGIAGPGGGTEDKPVGLCYIAVATSAKGKETVVKQVQGKASTREGMKDLFAQEALKMVLGNLPNKHTNLI